MALAHSDVLAYAALRDWLRHRTQNSIYVNLLGAAAFIALGLILLVVTVLIIYGLSGLVFPVSATLRTVLTVAATVAVFAGNSLLGQPLSAAVHKTAGLDASGMPKPGAQNLDTFQAFVRLVGTVVCCGPKALAFGASMIRKIQRLRKMDYDGCAAVLLLLLSRQSRMSYAEIKQRIPKLNTLAVFAQMEDIEGVLLLESEPPGLSLSEELRIELALFKPQ